MFLLQYGEGITKNGNEKTYQSPHKGKSLYIHNVLYQIHYDNYVTLACACCKILTLYPLPLSIPPCLLPVRAGDPHAESVAVGTTVACVLLLLLIALTVVSVYLILKNTVVKNDVPVVVPP